MKVAGDVGSWLLAHFRCTTWVACAFRDPRVSIFPTLPAGASPSPWRACCGSISCSSGVRCPILRWRPQMAAALCEFAPMRTFAGLGLIEDATADETTISKFRRSLEHHELTQQMMEGSGSCSTASGWWMRRLADMAWVTYCARNP